MAAFLPLEPLSLPPALEWKGQCLWNLEQVSVANTYSESSQHDPNKASRAPSPGKVSVEPGFLREEYYGWFYRLETT